MASPDITGAVNAAETVEETYYETIATYPYLKRNTATTRRKLRKIGHFKAQH